MYKQLIQPIKMIQNLPSSEAKEFALQVVDNPMKYFCPNIVQERIINEFNDCVQESKISTNLFTCGNQLGKTLSVVQIAGNLIWGVQNGWFDLEVFKNWQYPKRIWLITTPANLKETYFNETSKSSFHSIFRGKEWIPKKDNKPWYSKVEFPGTGWDMSIYSYNQAASEFESAQVGIIIADEPTPFSIWEGLPSRLSAGGTFLMPQTPENIDAYIITDVVKKAKGGVAGFRHIEGATTEVTTDKERGHYDPDVLAAQRERYTKDEDDIRVKGKILYFKERVIEGLDDHLHFVNPADYPLKDTYLYYHIFDPHASRPNAECWGAVTPEGRRIIFAERPESQLQPFWNMIGSEEYAEHKLKVEFYEAAMRRKYNMPLQFERVIDRHYGRQQRVPTEKSTIKEYMKLGWNLRESYTSVDEREFGHKKIQQLLKILPDGKPGLVIWNTCYHTWNGLINSVRQRPRTEAQLMKPAGSGNIVEKYYCFVSVVRYFVCHEVFGFEKDKKEVYVRDDFDGGFL
ncbi:MAG: hypothetical protein HQ534_10720 [Armatimonadetes bacterium]|nr:hypothetical protein [Armatimonadota bacterium]